MQLIPEIDFKDSELPEVGFEVIDLKKLYFRYESGKLPIIGIPHRISFHNLLYITEGSGEHFVDFNKFPVEKGNIIFINKGQVHTFDIKHKPCGKLIVFTDEYVQKVAAAIGVQILPPTHFMSNYLPSFKLEKSVESQLKRLIEIICYEFQASEINTKFLQALFAAFLIKTSEARPDIYHADMTQQQIDGFNRFISALGANYRYKRDAHYYAELTGVSYKTLNKLCKLATNKTAKQLIDSYIILEAKRRLVIDNIQIQQLSEDFGFDEVSNFVKYFKKHTLSTPTQFKKNH